MDTLLFYLRAWWPMWLAALVGVSAGAWLGGVAGLPWCGAWLFALVCGAALAWGVTLIFAAATLRP